jgi:hypothetical protein
MVYRLCTRIWKRLVAACVAIQRNWLLRRSAKKLKKKLKEERQVGQMASLNIANRVKSKAVKAVAANNERTVRAAISIQKNIRYFLTRKRVKPMLLQLQQRIAEYNEAQALQQDMSATRLSKDESKKSLEPEDRLDMNIELVQKQGLEPFYWTVDQVRHKLGGQPDQTAMKRPTVRAGTSEKVKNTGRKRAGAKQLKARKRKSLSFARKHPSDPIDDYEYFDIYCGTRPAEEVQAYLALLQKGSDTDDFGGDIAAEILQSSKQHKDDTEVSEGLFDIAIQGDMNFRIQNVESTAKRPFQPAHPLLANTEYVLKNFGDVHVDRGVDEENTFDLNGAEPSAFKKESGRRKSRVSIDYAVPRSSSLASDLVAGDRSASMFSGPQGRSSALVFGEEDYRASYATDMERGSTSRFSNASYDRSPTNASRMSTMSTTSMVDDRTFSISAPMGGSSSMGLLSVGQGGGSPKRGSSNHPGSMVRSSRLVSAAPSIPEA